MTRRWAGAALTVEQAAERVFVDVKTIEAWIAAGLLIAVRTAPDGPRYVDEEQLVDVECDVRVRRRAAVVRPEPLSIPGLVAWLCEHGYPTTEEAVRHWVKDKALSPVRPGGRGRGRAALFDPLDALTVASVRALRSRRPARSDDGVAGPTGRKMGANGASARPDDGSWPC